MKVKERLSNMINGFLPQKTILALMILITLFPLNGVAQMRLVASGSVYSVAFSPDGGTLGTLASGGFDIELWNPHTGELLRTIETWGLVLAIAFSPDGRTLASGDADNTVQLWNARTGEHIRTLEDHTDWVNTVAFSPDGNTLASGSGSLGGNDFTVRLWNVQTGEHIRTLEDHTEGVDSVAFSPDGSTLASGGNDAVRLWNVQTGEPLRALEVEWTQTVTYSPDGDTLASGGYNDTVELWNVHTGEHLQTLPHDGVVESVAFSPDGSTLASGTWGPTVWLWNVETGEPIQTFEGHTDWVKSVAFSPDGSTLASGSDDGTIRLWRLVTAQLSITPSPVQSPPVGEQLTINANIADATNIAGFELVVDYDETALAYVEVVDGSDLGSFLPAEAFSIPPVVAENRVTLAATSLEGAVSGDGTLATLTFEGVAPIASEMHFSVTLVTPEGERMSKLIHIVDVTAPPIIPEDANGDGTVNILDLVLVAQHLHETGENVADVNGDGVVNILDLVAVAGALNQPAAPGAHAVPMLTPELVEEWLMLAEMMGLLDPASRRGIAVLEYLLATLTPKETMLLPNYPNPFNPETWIPYQLTHDAHVKLTIYDANGALVRLLDVGHQPPGFYTDRGRAVYWDGRNERGESVASGVYFYRLEAGDYSHMRRMVLVK